MLRLLAYRLTQTVIAFVSFTFASAAFASPGEPSYESSGWKYSISPYIWGLGMNGTIGVGARRAHLDQTFGDVLAKLNIAGMLWLDAHNGKFGVFLNSLYASMSDEANQGPFSVHDRNQFTLVSGGLSYEVYEYCFGSNSRAPSRFLIEPYAGFRYTANQVSLKFSTPSLSVTANNNQYWTDPIAGARFISQFSNGMEVNLSGDIGGINASNQYSYNIIGLLGYQPQTYMKNTTWYLGYRILDQVYKTGNGLQRFSWNMKLTGPLIGAAFTF